MFIRLIYYNFKANLYLKGSFIPLLLLDYKSSQRQEQTREQELKKEFKKNQYYQGKRLLAYVKPGSATRMKFAAVPFELTTCKHFTESSTALI